MTGTQLTLLGPSPPPPLLFQQYCIHATSSSAPVFPTPRTLDGVGGYEMACGHCRRPRKKQTCYTTFINVAGSRGASRPFPRKTLPHNFSSPLRESRGASRPFPRKTLSHNFHHRGCIPRGFSYVLVSVPQGPGDGSSQESFVLHRDQGTRQGTKQGTKQDSAPSGTQPPHFTLSFP